MIKIPQYQSLLSFYTIFLILLPNIILNLGWKKKNKTVLIVTNGLLIVTLLGTGSIQLFEFVLFIIYEIALTYLYLALHQKYKGRLVFFVFLIFSMCPILLVRICAFFPDISTYVGFTGISYICFKIWQLLIDIYDERIKTIPIADFFLFICFFPSFSSGPIARFEDFTKHTNESTKDYIYEYLYPGLKKIFLGVLYKYAFAVYIDTLIIKRIPDEVSFISVILYMYAYTFYLFFDFAGYSGIAIGIAYLLGIKLPENFDKPFLASNMKEFWSRWHMSLSSWFTDYVYGRVTLNCIRNGVIKNPKTASHFAYIITMLLMGLWHGFSFHYLVYGIYEGILMVATDIWVRSPQFREVRKKKLYPYLSRVICFQFIAFGMLLFSGKYLF